MSPRKPRPTVPPKEVLIRFFADRGPVPLDDAAQLLGFSKEWVRARATADAALLPGEQVAWEAVMHWFLQVWPRDAVVAVLSPDTDVLLPRGLHLVSVQWRLPAYLVTALEAQATLDRRKQRDRHDTSVS